jgi:photosystem II stability/assembly factor-like uncharacterized protein
VRNTAKIALLLSLIAGVAYIYAPRLRSQKVRGSVAAPPPHPGGWDVRQIDTGLPFRDVQFLDQTVGWGTTSEGLWRTTDGGGHWSLVRNTQSAKLPVVNFSSDEIMDGVQFLNAGEGWVVEGGHLIHTTDGGGTWVADGIENTLVTSCFFLNPNEGWSVGQRMRLPKGPGSVDTWHKIVYGTKDGGASWSRLYEERDDDPYPIDGLCATSRDDIWAGGTVHSTDGGVTWKPVNIQDRTGVGGGPCSITFLDRLVGWITTNGPGGYLYTGDGGANWEPRPAPPDFNGSGPRPLVYVNPTEAWAAAVAGMYHSTDTGKTWVKVLDGHYTGVLLLGNEGTLMAFGRDFAVKRLAAAASK